MSLTAGRCIRSVTICSPSSVAAFGNASWHAPWVGESKTRRPSQRACSSQSWRLAVAREQRLLSYFIPFALNPVFCFRMQFCNGQRDTGGTGYRGAVVKKLSTIQAVRLTVNRKAALLRALCGGERGPRKNSCFAPSSSKPNVWMYQRAPATVCLAIDATAAANASTTSSISLRPGNGCRSRSCRQGVENMPAVCRPACCASRPHRASPASAGLVARLAQPRVRTRARASNRRARTVARAGCAAGDSTSPAAASRGWARLRGDRSCFARRSGRRFTSASISGAGAGRPPPATRSDRSRHG